MTTPPPIKMAYTYRDSEMLAAVLGCLMSETGDIQGAAPITNNLLAEAMGLSVPGMVYRLKRLEALGIITLRYGRQHRTIQVNYIPDRPWDPVVDGPVPDLVGGLGSPRNGEPV